jgi:hypothetical protein
MPPESCGLAGSASQRHSRRGQASMTEDPRKAVEKLWRDHLALIRDFATVGSAAILLAENESLGELVMYSLLDDERVQPDLWPRLKLIAGWLEEAEQRYKAQFPEGFPTKDGRYDLTHKPGKFKTRLQIFTELAEAWESSELWSAEVKLNDPVFVVKKMKLKRLPL